MTFCSECALCFGLSFFSCLNTPWLSKLANKNRQALIACGSVDSQTNIQPLYQFSKRLNFAIFSGLFQTDGVLQERSRCDFLIESVQQTNASNGTSSLESVTRGRFFSPQYPSTYPKGIKCSYSFSGQPHEKIKLIFEQIRLQKSDSR